MEHKASDTYELVEQRMRKPKRWMLMAGFWLMALVSMGSATPVPATKSWAIVRKSDGFVASVVDDEMAGEISVETQLRSDMSSMTTSEFEAAWGIEPG